MPVWPINFESELQGELVRAHSEDDAFHSLNVNTFYFIYFTFYLVYQGTYCIIIEYKKERSRQNMHLCIRVRF